MLVTLAQIRSRSNLLTDTYPLGAPGDAGLQVLIDDASGVLMSLTGRAIGVAEGLEGPFGCLLVDVPPALASVALRAITLYAERFEMDRPSAAERIEILSRQSGGLSSFTAGPYSESYFSPGDAITTRALDADAAMARDLWGLATDCVRSFWMRLWDPSAPNAPASAVMSFDWSGDPEMDPPWWP